MVDKLSQFVRHIELVRDRITDWSAYPFSIPAVASLDRLTFPSQVTFFVGENGSGKSTLIEAIALKLDFPGQGGTKNFRADLHASESDLHAFLRVARGTARERGSFFLRAETMFNISTAAQNLGAYGMEDLHEMSHGEAFLKVAMDRFGARGLYIMDEPEAALSPQRQLAFLARMRQLVNQGSQLIIATHSPILLAYPGATIYVLDQDGISKVAYQDTEHYGVTRAFLQNPERMLRDLFHEIDAERG